jgi:hypothetical protein
MNTYFLAPRRLWDCFAHKGRERYGKNKPAVRHVEHPETENPKPETLSADMMP